jgi:hypothetical protein
MKEGKPWVWVIIVGAGLFLAFYYFYYSFWPPYFLGNWGYRAFGPKFWFPFPFLGFFLIILLGVIFFRLLLTPAQRKDSLPKENMFFCPYCGRDLRSAEKSTKTKENENIPLPRS